MDKEVDLLINLLDNIKELKNSSGSVWQGNIHAHNVFISKCGIGKVNSALNAYRLITEYKPDFVINSGVAGGAGVPVGSLLIADKVAYHDVWCGPGTKYGQADGIPLYILPDSRISGNFSDIDCFRGLSCSGDKFISTEEEINFIKFKFPDVKAVDMESASIAQTCFILGIPFTIIRVVSDTPGAGENIFQYKDFWENAPKKTFSVLSEILRLLE